MHTYRNPWFKAGVAGGTDDPEIYRCESAPVQIGKYQCFHRIKDRKPSRNCYDYVLNGVVVTQRGGSGWTEAELDAYLANEASEKVRTAVLSSEKKNGSSAAHARCDDEHNPSGRESCGLTTRAAA